MPDRLRSGWSAEVPSGALLCLPLISFVGQRARDCYCYRYCY
jgi:hypothetical protein